GPVAVVAAERSVSILRDLGDQRQLAHALRALSNAYRMVGDSVSDDLALAESAELARAAGDVYSEAGALVVRGSIGFGRGDNEAALELSMAAVDLATAHSLREPASAAYHTCGIAHFSMGNLDAAETSFKASLLTYRDGILPSMALFPLDGLAAVAAQRGDYLR